MMGLMKKLGLGSQSWASGLRSDPGEWTENGVSR